MLAFDSHVHTRFSDGTIFYNGIADLKELHRKHGFDAFTITDHNTTKGLRYASRACEHLGIPFIPGLEISAKEGHVVAYGVERWEHPAYRLPLVEVLELLMEQNAVIVPAHPFDGRMGIGNLIFEPEIKRRIHGFEIFNGASPRQNLRCTRKAGNLPGELAMYAGSDCHSKVMFYRYHVELDCNSTKVDDILEAMRDTTKVKPVGSLLEILRWIGDYVPAEIGRRNLKRARKGVEVPELFS